jgi:hypothetical protein
MQATSARGRERARLQVEACPSGSSFGSLNCSIRIGDVWSDLGTHPLGVNLVLPLTDLSFDRVYHWRARAQYVPFSANQAGIGAPPNPRAGPWRRLNANADVADIRTTPSSQASTPIFADGFED